MRTNKFLGVTLSLLLVMVSGCSFRDVPDPELTVQAYWQAIVAHDFAEAVQYVAVGVDEKGITETLWLGEGDVLEDSHAAAYIGRIKLTTTGHQILGKSATVDVVIEWPDLELLFANYLAESFIVAFNASFSGATEEEIDVLLEPIFGEVLAETPDVFTEHQVELVLEKGQWRLIASPVPSPETVFDLDDF